MEFNGTTEVIMSKISLGGEMKVASVENQLSGLGFSMTQRAEVVCQVRGSIDRVLKIQF